MSEKTGMKINFDSSLVPDNRNRLQKISSVYNSQAWDTIKTYMPPDTLGKPKDVTLAMDSCLQTTLSGVLNFNALAFSSVPRFLGYALLSNIAQEGLIRAGVDIISDHMTRKWIDIVQRGESEEEQNRVENLTSDMALFKCKDVFQTAYNFTGYFGGCLVYIDVGELTDEEKKEPLVLDEKLFKQGSLRRLVPIEPINIYPAHYNTTDPTDPSYFTPDSWYILGTEYHASRFLYFADNIPPVLLKPAYNFFGISRAQLALEYVTNFTANRESAQRLLNKFSLTCWKTDMSNVLAGISGSVSTVIERAQMFNTLRDNNGTMLIDKEQEDMVQLNTPLGGVTDIVQMSLDLLTVIFHTPDVVFFGKNPKGLGGSDAEAVRIFYDYILGLVSKIGGENLDRLIKLLQLNRFGTIDDSITYRINPLWEMDDKEIAELNKIKADTDAVLSGIGAISGNEIRDRLAADPESGFSNIEVDENEDLLDFENDPEEVIEDMASDAWITIKPNGKEHKGQPLFIGEGETPKQAMERKFGKSLDKEKKDETPKAGGYDIKKETQKAFLLTDGQKEFWVQKRWVKGDKLTPAGEKAYTEAQTIKEKEKAKEDAKKKREEGVKPPKADWESDKAYGYDLNLDFYDTETNARHRIFVPKSVIQKNGNIPSWILDKKVDEISDKYKGRGGFHITDHPFEKGTFGERDLKRESKGASDAIICKEISAIINDELVCLDENEFNEFVKMNEKEGCFD